MSATGFNRSRRLALERVKAEAAAAEKAKEVIKLPTDEDYAEALRLNVEFDKSKAEWAKTIKAAAVKEAKKRGKVKLNDE